MNVKKAAAIFLALMAALTFLSRALDSFTVIRVKTGYGKQDVIPYAIQGEGELTAGRTVYISLRRTCRWRKSQPGPDSLLRQETRS